MNIFKDKSSIIGDAQISHLNRTFIEFFEQAHEIRARLNTQEYLLDKYLSFLFDAANNTIAINSASAGFESEFHLNRICLDVLRRDSENEGHIFYKRAKEYIDANSLTYRELPTKLAIYCTILASEYCKIATEKYIKKLEDKLFCRRRHL